MSRPGFGGSDLVVQVYRDGLRTPWGFRLQGGTDYECPLTVQRIATQSAVDGSLMRGDVILKVDDYDATRLTHDDALHLISTAGSSLKLTIRRNVGRPTYNVRSHSQPIFGRQTPISEDGEEEDKYPKLADIMKESLQMRERGTMDRIKYQSHSRPTTPSYNSWSTPIENITSYLPKPPPKRLTQAKANDAHIRSQVRDSMMSRSPFSSGRSSPAPSSVIEFGSPTDANRPVGVWVPPLHQPNSKLVHLQYNSPMTMYSSYNVADTVEKMTGSKLQWLNQAPSPRYLDDIRDSPTYKFIQEMEGRSAPKAPGPYGQSATIKNLNRYFRLDESNHVQ